MRAVLISVLVLAVAFAAGRKVSLTTCGDSLFCEGARCNTQNLTTGTCYGVEGSLVSLSLECSAGDHDPCISAKSYSDSECNTPYGALNALCSTCQDNFTFSCGALADGVFWVVNCTDNSCNNCGGAHIAIYNKCVALNPGVWGKATGMENCTAVTAKFYSGSQGCSGTPQYTRLYASGMCLVGTNFKCASAVGDDMPDTAELKLVNGVKRPMITLGKEFLAGLPFN